MLGTEEVARRQAFLQTIAALTTRIEVRSAAAGYPSSESERDAVAVSPHIVAGLQRAAEEGAAAGIVGCFSDPALDAVRETVRMSVVGPGQSSVVLALQLGEGFSILSRLDSAAKRQAPRLRGMGVADRLASIRGVGVSVVDLARRSNDAMDRITAVAERCVSEDGADVLVMGCMSMAFIGIERPLAERIGLPVVSAVLAALKTAGTLLDLGLSHAHRLARATRQAVTCVIGGTRGPTGRRHRTVSTASRNGTTGRTDMLGRPLLAVAAALAAGVLALPAEAQRRPNEIVWGDQLPGGLDSHVIADVPMQFIQLSVYDELYRYQGNPPELVPWLASAHAVSADGLTWAFRLRPGIKFHDGREMTAEDVVYSFQRVLALRRGPAAAFLPILDPTGVTAPNKLTVQFRLKSAYAPFPAAIPLVAIANSTLVKANERNGYWGAAWLSSNVAGSAAYRLDPATYRPQELADLTRFNDHFLGWSHNQKPIEIVRSRPILETTTRANALLRGDIDATDSYPPTDMVERVGRARGARVARDESMRVMVIRINNQRPPFDNVHFRRCLSHAFNYPGFITGILRD